MPIVRGIPYVSNIQTFVNNPVNSFNNVSGHQLLQFDVGGIYVSGFKEGKLEPIPSRGYREGAVAKESYCYLPLRRGASGEEELEGLVEEFFSFAFVFVVVY